MSYLQRTTNQSKIKQMMILLIIMSTFTISFTQTSIKQNNLSTLFWEKGVYDEITNLINLDSHEVLLTTNHGVISTIDKESTLISNFKNKYSYLNKNIKLFVSERYIVVIYIDEGNVEVLKKDSLEIVNSFIYNPTSNTNIKLIHVEFLRVKNKQVGVFVSSASIILFNEVEVIDEFFVNPETQQVIEDYYIQSSDNTNYNLQLLLSSEANLQSFSLDEYKLTPNSQDDCFDLIKESQITLKQSLEKSRKVYLTSNNIVIIDNKGIIYLRKNEDNEKSIEIQDEFIHSIIKSKDSMIVYESNSNKAYKVVFAQDGSDHKIQNLTISNETKSSKNYQYRLFNVDSLNKNNENLLYLVKFPEVESNTDIEVNTSNSKSKLSSNLFYVSIINIEGQNAKVLGSESYSIEDNCNFSHFSSSSNKDFSVVCNKESIYHYQFGSISPVWTMNENYSNPDFTKIVNINNLDLLDNHSEEEKRKISINSLITSSNINQEINNLLGSVVKNTFDSLSYITDLFTSVIEKVQTGVLMNPQALQNKQTTLLIFMKKSTIKIYDILKNKKNFEIKFNNQKITCLDAYFSNTKMYSTYSDFKNEHGNNIKSPYLYIEFLNEDSASQNTKQLLIISLKNYNDYILTKIPNSEELLKTQIASLVKNQNTVVSENIDSNVLSAINSKIETLNESSLTHVHNSLKNKITNSSSSIIGKRYVHIDNNTIYGISINDTKNIINIAWSLKAKLIINVVFPQYNKNSSLYQSSQGKIYHKYINPNIMAVISKNTSNSILIEVIDSTNGKILKKINIERVVLTQPIIPVFNENHLIVAYVKEEKSVYKQEILSVEIMKREIEQNFLTLINKIFNPDESKAKTYLKADPVFLTHTFIFSKKIKNMYLSQSLISVSNKTLLVVNENNLMSIVDLRNISARRPIINPTPNNNKADTLNSIYVDTELPGYNPIIVNDYKNILSKNYLNEAVDQIVISPTAFESTFILCSYGIGVKCYKVTPDNTFDSLSDNFKYSLIGLFLIAIFIITFALRNKVKVDEFKSTFLKE